MSSFVVGDDGINRIVKDPQARLDYKFDWSEWLGSDTIATATFSVESGAGVTIATSSNDDTSATVWLTGGTAGMSATVTCHITTSINRQDDRSFIVVIEER